ncbi:MAG: hypothetical protein AB7R55_03605 [Gemmatimonadales bacterium]
MIRPLPQVVLFLLPLASLSAQSERATLGVEARAYPAGVIAAGRLDLDLGRRTRIGFTAGYNLTRRGDFGEHDDERGGGGGLGVLVTTRLGDRPSGFYLGGRIDLWWLDIDWTDRSPARAGTTAITVVQPTARGGYGFSLAGGRWRLETGLALGSEVNLRTGGERVGEGAILLAEIGLLWRP